MIIITKKREMIEITTIVDLIMRMNYDNMVMTMMKVVKG